MIGGFLSDFSFCDEYPFLTGVESTPIGFEISFKQDQDQIGFQVNNQSTLGIKKVGFELTSTLNNSYHICGGFLSSEPYLTQYRFLSLVLCNGNGFQISSFITNQDPTGFEIASTVNSFKTNAFQIEGKIDFIKPLGFQFTSVFSSIKGFQFRGVLYNTYYLRIMSTFSSRGNTGIGGTNAWGNTGGTGLNWIAGSTQSGFNIKDVNSDIIEQVWRSATGVKITNITCDTEITQGVFVDTIAILNHNFTSTAAIVFQGSNDSTFSTVTFSQTLTWEKENMYYISPEIPTLQLRYWRFILNDGTNPDDFLRVGTILFGSSEILQGDQFVDQITYGKRHYKDQVFTEGFTNVSNDRAVKKYLKLSFQSLTISGRNYGILRDTFDFAKTQLKCLWIPTPQYPSRYAIFAKLNEMPEEKHNDKGFDADYVSLDVNLDESL